jgi:hypothetical protein
MHLNRQPDCSQEGVKLGLAKDSVRLPDSVLRVYHREQMLPMHFQLLYDPRFDNPGLDGVMRGVMGIEAVDSLHGISNMGTVRQLGYHHNRLLLDMKQGSGETGAVVV